MLNIDKPVPLVYHQGNEVFKESRANAIFRKKNPQANCLGVSTRLQQTNHKVNLNGSAEQLSI